MSLPSCQGHELWEVTKRMRSEMAEAEIWFLPRVVSLSLRDGVRRSVLREELRVEPLLLHAQRSQSRWFGHQIRMPPGRFLGEVFQACPSQGGPGADPGYNGEVISRLIWEHLGVSADKIKEVVGEWEVLYLPLCLGCCPQDPDKLNKVDGWIDTVLF